jgi:methionyl-tRNA formyltransferase
MDITVLCTSPSHPILPKLRAWVSRGRAPHSLRLVTSLEALQGTGDILFLVSVPDLISKAVRNRYKATLVLHAGALPEDRGWSPHIWRVVEGQSTVTVSVIAAEDKVDTGAIWAQREFGLQGHELADEINEALFATELELMGQVIDRFDSINPRLQPTEGATYRRKRTPEDSRIDTQKSIAEQFDLLRVADPDRYPAFFEHRGFRYQITLKKVR